MSDHREEFDARSARTRQPLPLWVGAFDRATDEMAPEAVGAYMLILMAMWRSKSCDLPADEKYLARVVRVSPTTWRRKLAPIILPMLSTRNLRIFSEKLEEIARKTEEFCLSQFKKKAVKKSDKPLNKKETHQTGDDLEKNHGETPADPKPITLNKKEEEGARAHARGDDFFEGEEGGVSDALLRQVIEAVGLSKTDLPRFWMGAAVADHVRAWIGAHGLTEAEIVAEAAKSRRKNPEPPDGPKALDRWMEQAGAAKRSAAGVKPGLPVATSTAKPPVSPIDRLAFYADWIKDRSKSLPPSTISNTLRDALVNANMVTTEDLRWRGIR